MSKRDSILVKIIVRCVIAFLLLSALVVLLSRSASGWRGIPSLTSWADLKTVQEESFDLDAINELEFDFSSMDIEVYVTDAKDLQVKLLANRDLLPEERFVSSVQDGRISIQNKQRFSFLNLFALSGLRKLEVYLPEQYGESLRLKSASGNITLPDELALKAVKLNLLSGELRGGSIQADDFNLGISSGNIRLSDVKSLRYTLKITSGDTMLESVEGTGTIRSSSGKIRINSLTGGEHEISSSSGSITLGRFIGCGSISAQSGDIEIDSALPQGDLDIKVNSGRVALELAKEAVVKVKADVTSGNVRSTLPLSYDRDGKRATGQVGENPGAMLSIRITSGDIRLSQAEQ